MLREVATEAHKSLKNDLAAPISRELLDQLLSRKRKRLTGELTRGESLEMREVATGERAEKERLSRQLQFEHKLREEERILVERRSNELSLHIKAIHEQVIQIAHATPQLSREIELASIQAPSTASSYELFFIKHILDRLRKFRMDVENASVWFATANARASKRNVWGQNYKKHGAQYLLSGEHYSGRSAA